MSNTDQISKLDALSKRGEGFGGRGREMRWINPGAAVNLNVAAAPFEWLSAKGHLETVKDEPGHGLVRFSVAMHFRRVMEGSQIAGLKGQSFEGASGGSAGARPVSDYKLDCMRQVASVAEGMSADLFRLLTMVVCDDVWLWEVAPPSREVSRLRSHLGTVKTAGAKAKIERKIKKVARSDQRKVIEHLLKAIDSAAVSLGYLTYTEFRLRWIRPRSTKKPAPSSKNS